MPVAPMLADLVDASLVTVAESSDPPQYRMLTVVRAEAARILNASGCSTPPGWHTSGGS